MKSIFTLVQFVTGAVVQLKTISGALSADESLSDFATEKIRLLQQILTYVVSIIYIFIDLGYNIDKKDELFCSLVGFVSHADAPVSSSNSSRVLSTEARLHWRQKAVVSVMEAGGLNWLVGKVGICCFVTLQAPDKHRCMKGIIDSVNKLLIFFG